MRDKLQRRFNHQARDKYMRSLSMVVGERDTLAGALKEEDSGMHDLLILGYRHAVSAHNAKTGTSRRGGGRLTGPTPDVLNALGHWRESPGSAEALQLQESLRQLDLDKQDWGWVINGSCQVWWSAGSPRHGGVRCGGVQKREQASTAFSTATKWFCMCRSGCFRTSSTLRASIARWRSCSGTS